MLNIYDYENIIFRSIFIYCSTVIILFNDLVFYFEILDKFLPFGFAVLNESSVSVNTPGKKEDSVVKIHPSFSGDSRNPSDISASPVHIIAAKNENRNAAILHARKICNLPTTVFQLFVILEMILCIFQVVKCLDFCNMNPFLSVHCEDTEQGLRRSSRNRVAPIRHWLGEKPVYRRDQQGSKFYDIILMIFCSVMKQK